MRNHCTYPWKHGFRVPLICLMGIMALATLCGGCRQKSTTESNKSSGVEPNTTASDANQVAVLVNGLPITNGQIDPVVEEQLKPFADRMTQLPSEFVEQRKKEMRREILDKIIAERLLDEQVKGQGIAISDEEMQKKIGDLASRQQPPMSGEEFLAKVQASGLTVETFQRDLRRNMGYFKLFEGQWAGKTEVTDQEAKTYYDKNPEDFKNPEMVRASHILIQPDTQVPGVDPNQAKAQAKAKAEDLLSKIRGGEDFAELAKTHSSCPSAANGGDLDYFKRGEMDAPFEKAAFELAPGQVSGVVETSYGFHIIKVTDHRPARIIPFEEAKAGIVEKLATEKKTQIIRDYIESLKAKANIQYTTK